MAVQLLNAPKLNTNYASNDSYGKLGQYLLNSVHQKNVLAEQKAQNNALGQYRNQQLGLEKERLANQQTHNETMQALQGQKVANDYALGLKKLDKKETSGLTPYQDFSIKLKLQEQQQRQEDKKAEQVMKLGKYWDSNYGSYIDGYENLSPEQQDFMRKKYIDSKGTYNPTIKSEGGFLGFGKTYMPNEWVNPEQKVVAPKADANQDLINELKSINEEMKKYKY